MFILTITIYSDLQFIRYALYYCQLYNNTFLDTQFLVYYCFSCRYL